MISPLLKKPKSGKSRPFSWFSMDEISTGILGPGKLSWSLSLHILDTDPPEVLLFTLLVMTS